MFNSYSVGGYKASGAMFGAEFDTLPDAQAYLAALPSDSTVASAILYGWPDDCDFDELHELDSFTRE